MISQSELAYRELRRMILAGDIASEEPISERSLSERLGLGRTPVREALKELGRVGLIAVIPGRGTFLKTLTLHELREHYELRMGVEGIAAYLAALRGPSRQLTGFREIFEEHLNSPNTRLVEIQDQGTKFQHEVVVCSRNSRLITLHGDLRDQIELTMRLTRNYDHSRVRETISEHMEILQAVLDRNPEKAQQAIYTHLSNAVAAGVRIFSRLEVQVAGPGG